MPPQPETPAPEALSRPRVADLDALLGRPFAVLDDGFVRVVDYMGDDAAVVQAARVSYGRGTKRVSDDRGLIRYLMRHRHTTPFEMCELKLHVRVPMDAWRQWIRHRTASVNEYSTRYSIAIDAAQRTAPDAWRLQAAGNRQGSEGVLAPESCRTTPGTSTGTGSSAASPASRPARICPYPPTPRPTGKSTCTTCCISWPCAWTRTPSRRSAATPP